jgi:hypothetical protein
MHRKSSSSTTFLSSTTLTRAIASTILAFLSLPLYLLASSSYPQSPSQSTSANPYPTMAPLEQYLMPDRDAEIALARSAAPASISQDADVMVLGRHGYETAAHGKNGFVCLVWRSWAGSPNDADFWNPKARSPVCLNPAAARFNVPLTQKRTQLILAGKSQAQVFAELESAFQKNEFPALEPGAMCYMLSKQGRLNNVEGPWHAHLMFFIPLTDSATWGAGAAGSPVVGAFNDTVERHTVFLVPVTKWSDGTPDTPGGH